MTHSLDRPYGWTTPAGLLGPVTRTRAHATGWVRSFRRIVAASDAVVVILVTGISHLAFFGVRPVAVSSARDYGLDYITLSIVLVIAWIAALGLSGSRDERILGADSTEYQRVVRATLALFGALAILTLLFQVDIARGYLLTALPAGVLLLVATRWAWRRWLHARRRDGEYAFRVLLVGSGAAVAELNDALADRTDAGYAVVGVAITGDDIPADVHGVRAFAAAGDFEGALAASRPDVVMVVGGEELGADRINEISWRLDPGQQLVVAPQLVGVAGNRIHTRPVAGLPLIHVETPSYDGAKVVIKRAFDIVGSAALLLLLAPVLLAVALLVRLSSRGPALYRQERIGHSGEPFGMLKFRSMVVGADAQLAALLAAQGSDGEPLFKVKDDPRITPIGRLLRRYSIDELPQLINVLKGDMSLVGPRPQRAIEVELYDPKASRRLVVKPGMSGLWQVSGRSNLSWDDAIRLDLYYVENWSLTGDIIILLRTARAVLAHDGAV